MKTNSKPALKVKSSIKAGGITLLNHNRTCLAA